MRQVCQADNRESRIVRMWSRSGVVHERLVKEVGGLEVAAAILAATTPDFAAATCTGAAVSLC